MVHAMPPQDPSTTSFALICWIRACQILAGMRQYVVSLDTIIGLYFNIGSVLYVFSFDR